MQKQITELADQISPARLSRLLDPQSVAIVGVSENSPYAAAARRTLLSDAEIVFVHPRVESVFGRKTFPNLEAVGRPVDCVFSALAAERTIDLATQAVRVGAGGLISIANGFSEMGAAGAALQNGLVKIARDNGLPVVGPNGIGVINLPRRLELTMLPEFGRRPGGLSVVTHSGAMIESIAAACWRAGGAGINLMISAGNEAVTDLADYLSYLVADPKTRVIALALEKIRRPDRFFSAAAAALKAGKPIVVVKLSRSKRSQIIAASHTATLTGDAWVYDAAFRQAGIEVAADVDDLADRVQFFEQLSLSKWTPVRGLAVLSGTGGFAQLASDICEPLGIDLPEGNSLKEWVSENVPGGPIPNPLDATAQFPTKPGLLDGVVERYSRAPEFDTLLLINAHAEWNEPGRNIADRFAQEARTSDRTIILAPFAGQAGWWMDDLRKDGVAIGSGMRGTLNGLAAMSRFVRGRRDREVKSSTTIPPVARPVESGLATPNGLMLPFAASMKLLRDCGVPIAPFSIVDADATTPLPPFAGPYVVKLADIPHRTEYQAVKLDVPEISLSAAVTALRQLASKHGLPDTVSIQPMIRGGSELFIGLKASTELGPLTVFGIGGILVEVIKKVGGLVGPFERQDALEMLAEFDQAGLLGGVRGSPRFDLDELSRILVAAGRLASGSMGWMESIDINPIMVTGRGMFAVDALVILKHDAEV